MFIKPLIEKAVKSYLDGLSEARKAQIVGALGLTEGVYRSLIESAKGDLAITIYFADGSTASISNRQTAGKAGPGW